MHEDMDTDELYDRNMAAIDVMNSSALYLIKSLLYELERKGRNTYIELFDAEPDGHEVSYRFVSGDPDLVVAVARALRFKEATDSKLVVNSD